MSNVTTIPKQQAVTVRSLIAQPAIAARFKEVLKDKAEQFASSLINISNGMKDVEPHSVIQSAMVAAALDLPIDRNLGFAWIVPFKNKGQKMAQFQMGFKGFIQLALRSGQYKRMNARAINAEALDGFDEVGEPKIDWTKINETKPTAGYVFAFQLVNGFTKCAYWSKQRVEEHAKRYSQSFRGGYDSPWKTHFDEMALKTVIKNELPKWGIMSIQMQKAVETDQGVITVDGEVEFLDNQPEVKAPDFGDVPQIVDVSEKESPKPTPEPVVVKTEDLPPMQDPLEVPAANPQIAALEAALVEAGIEAHKVVTWCKANKLTVEGKDGLASIREDKLEKLTKNIKANGPIVAQIKAVAQPQARLLPI